MHFIQLKNCYESVTSISEYTVKICIRPAVAISA